MASPFQQQSLRRKIIYTVSILLLFTLSVVLKDQRVHFSIAAQAQALEIREEDRGEVELAGSALRLMLTGSRGIVTCGLWWIATHKQMKHEWNELELIVDSLTKLQPHFITPWLFQSWNLAYNVSVESDRVRDKYFYMTRGISLLAEGERQNKNHPDLRFSMGFYNQHKIGLSDEANYLRCLYQMSCMDPLKRSPDRFRKQDQNGNTVIDMKEFEDFCRESPFLVRRLREFLRRDTPADIVDFLAENQKIPSRYEDQNQGLVSGNSSPLKPLDKQFPVLAPLGPEDRDKGNPEDREFDNFVCCRDWFTHAVKPLPPPTTDVTLESLSYDKTKYRMPRYMTHIIFRSYPARGQAYVAEYLEKEGWFDQEGWKIKGWFPDDVAVGDDKSWAVLAWGRSHEMYRKHGLDNGLYIEPEELKNLQDRAAKFYDRLGWRPLGDGSDVPPEFHDDPGFKAHRQLHWYDYYRSLSNFPHFYFDTQVESDPQAVAVRKAFFAAEQLRKAGDRELALDTYREAMPKWKDILLTHTEFGRDPNIQEDTCEIDIKYLELVEYLYGKRMKQLLLMGDYLTQAAIRLPLTVTWLPPVTLLRDNQPAIETPFSFQDEQKKVPLIPDDVRALVRNRMGLSSPMPVEPPPTERPASGSETPASVRTTAQ